MGILHNNDYYGYSREIVPRTLSGNRNDEKLLKGMKQGFILRQTIKYAASKIRSTVLKHRYGQFPKLSETLGKII